MRRLGVTVILLGLLLCVPPASAEASFGLKDVDVKFVKKDGTASTLAGDHPYAMTVELAVNTVEDPVIGLQIPDGEVKDLLVTQIRGLAGNPTAARRCSHADFIAGMETTCPAGSRVGTARTTYIDPTTVATSPVYNLLPPPGTAAKLGFSVSGVRVAVLISAKATPPYNLVAEVTNIANVVNFYASQLTLWGTPAAPAHDAERGGPAGLPEIAFLTLPRSCEGPLATQFDAFSWEGDFFSTQIDTHDDGGLPIGFQGCDDLDFRPTATVRPTTSAAESSSGLEFRLNVDDDGVLDPGKRADSDIKRAVLTLPRGMTLNPSVAAGLDACSPAELGAEHRLPGPGGCPPASSIGSVTTTTPLLEDKVLRGELFLATPHDNPFGSLVALYMVIREPDLGLIFKLAGKVETDPATGQIVTTFGEPGHELPPYPLDEVVVRLRGGGRGPLITPPLCGTYRARSAFTPYGGEGKAVVVTSDFQIAQGVREGPCSSGGGLPFEPNFSAGTLENQAGSFSPFLLRIQRRDGDQDLVRFDATLPAGVVAKLAGVERCPDDAIAAIASRSGRQELTAGSCPPNSKIGSVVVGVGAGSDLTYVGGSVYLAGPYRGAPLSVVAVVPAVAGPFDIGVVTTRQGLRVDPVTAQPMVDGSLSDPIPHMLAGIPVKVRDVRVDVDRSHFTINPTSCRETSVEASIWGGGLDPFSAVDDAPVPRGIRFQAARCARLRFKPNLRLRLKGGVRRGDHPALRAVLRPRPGDANLRRVAVRFPRATFLDQGHIRTICTRIQFAAEACPKGAEYGTVRAWTPLLDEPLEGPVYLRSSDNLLPDVVFVLKGVVDLEAIGRVDSNKGQLRVTFAAIPDAPITRVVVAMDGGEKGLLVNSRDLCASMPRARVRMSAHNGRVQRARPGLRARGCSKGGG